MSDKSSGVEKLLSKISENRKNQILFIVFACLSLAVMITVFLFSNQPAAESSAVSSVFSDIFLDIFDFKAEDLPFDINSLETILRKLAHFTLFSALGFFLSSAAINLKGEKLFKKLSIAAFIGILYCATDEIHQLFVPQRSGEIRDVLIDTGGVIFGTLCAFVLYKLICLISKKNQKNKIST